MTTASTRYSVAQLVALRADPSRQGPVIEVLPKVAGSRRYRVFHSPTDIREYEEEQLIPVASPPKASDAFVDALALGAFLDADTFRARLTASRLAHPQVDSVYALHAARIRHVPFQYKPLLRLLRSEQPRLLIADEVGVGKTIEAGLILKELQTRQSLDRVLVVCPKALVPKWRAELRRFDEDFRPLSAENLRYCLNEHHLDGSWPAQFSRAIVHLELLRMTPYLQGTDGRRRVPGLFTLDPPPSFDLLIVDEAHHLRTPGTHSWQLAQFLCEISDTVLFLSATPVHVGSSNLFSLLNLLRPDLFLDESVFSEVISPNRYITQAIRHVRTAGPAPGWADAAADSLDGVLSTHWGARVLSSDPRFAEWRRRLRSPEPVTREERVRCIRDLEELHTLAHIVSRTRRRDIGRFTVREPHAVSVPFTPNQARFYGSLIDFRREVLSLSHDPQVVRLIADTLERQASSCLPGLAPAIDHFLRTGRFSSASLTDDPDSDEIDYSLPPHLVDAARELRSLAAALPPDEDPKLARLDTIIRSAQEDAGPGKVLVFSYFLHTLTYLEGQLAQRGLRVATVSGLIKDEAREDLRRRFRLPGTSPEAIDVLLSSEVGCEGLDYEFCDRLVNYDIPWNPMRIEQRIGRIDRFGQRSPKVLIYNFVTPGTVEERIFYRCFDRLGVFRDTVGDLEEVLGELTDQLTRLALDPSLTAEQAQLVAEQAADNSVRLAEEQRRLEEESSSLIGLADAFTADIDAVESEGRFVGSAELRAMLVHFLAAPPYAGRISRHEQDPRFSILRINRDGRSGLASRIRTLGLTGRTTIDFLRWLDGPDPNLLVTFDQEAALERRDVPFLTPVHPLARAAVASLGEIQDPLVSYLTTGDSVLAPGHYLFTCDLWETVAATPEVRLVPLAWNLDAGQPDPNAASRFPAILQQADWTSASPPPRYDLARAVEQLAAEAHRERQTALARLRERNDALVTARLTSLDTYYAGRLARVRDEFSSATNDLIRRMKEAERARIEREHTRRRREIESRRAADIVTQRVAIVLLEVRRAE